MNRIKLFLSALWAQYRIWKFKRSVTLLPPADNLMDFEDFLLYSHMTAYWANNKRYIANDNVQSEAIH
jgi:hypothetical protein